jgi:hypothetical protein
MSAAARTGLVLAVGVGGTVLVFGLMLWELSRPDTCGNGGSCSGAPASVYLFSLAGVLLGVAVAVAASARAVWLLLGVAIFVANTAAMAAWMGPGGRAEGGVVVALMWFALEVVALYSTAGVILLARRGEARPDA